MSFRFKILSAFFLLLVLGAQDQQVRPFGSVMDVFLGLLVLAILSAIALWPSNSRVERADGDIPGRNWADRIEFEVANRAPGGETE